MNRIQPAVLALAVMSVAATGCSADDADEALGQSDRALQIDAYVLGLGHLPAESSQSKTEADCDDSCPPDGQEGDLHCSYKRYTQTERFDQFVAFQPNSATLWPGSVVVGSDAQRGLLTPVGVRRAPLTFSMSMENINGSPVGQMAEPSLSVFREERNQILAAGVSGATAASLDFTMTQVHSESQLSIELGASVDWPGGGDVAASFHFGSEQERTKILVDFVQAYYTVDVDTPLRPSDFFSEDVTVEDLVTYAGDGNPPMYVQSITYGRRVIFSVESNRSAEEIEAALAATYSNAIDASVDLEVEYQAALAESKIHAFVLGGSAQDATGIIEGYQGLMDYIRNGADYGKDSPGAPIAYKLAYLDNAVTEFAFTTEYAERNCFTNRGTLTAELLHIDHISGTDPGSNLEVYGYVAMRVPVPDKPVEDCFTGGKEIVIWHLSDGEYIELPEYGTWTPASAMYETLEDVVIGPGSQLCIYAHFREDDDFIFNSEDDYSWNNQMLTFDVGWDGEHTIQTHGENDRSISATLKLTTLQ